MHSREDPRWPAFPGSSREYSIIEGMHVSLERGMYAHSLTEMQQSYPEAMATVRRIPSVEHNFQLVITRVYEEGDQEILEDEDESEQTHSLHYIDLISTFYSADEERVFLISEELEFRTGETDGEPTFIWRDLEGDVDEMYEYVAQGTNAPMKAFFETCMYHAMYERKYKVNPEEVKDPNLDEFMWKFVNDATQGRACLTLFF